MLTILEVEKTLREKVKTIPYLSRLRHYQLEGFIKVILAITQGKKPIRHLCTGAGKSIEQSSLVRYYYELNKKRVTDRKILVVGEKDEIVINAREQLLNIGISPQEIGIIKAGYPLTLDKPIQIASIPTLRRRYEKWDNSDLDIAIKSDYFDLILIDECHHAHNGTDKSYRELWRRYPKAKIVGYTATPEHEKGFTELFDLIIPGESQIELAHLGYLPYWEAKGIKCNADLSNVKKSKGDYDASALEAELQKSEALLQGDILPTWLKYVGHPYGKIPTILFARTVELSQEYADYINDKSEHKAVHIDGNMTRRQVVAALQQFASGEATFLVNCQKVIEGFDLAIYAKALGLELKSIGCVQDLAPTLSIKRHKQKVGRARGFLHEGKLKAIYLDHWGAYQQFGSPDQPYEWNLEGIATRVGDTTKRCPDEDCDANGTWGCGAVDIARTATKCPHCGFMFPVTISFLEDETVSHNKDTTLIPIEPEVLEFYNQLLSVEKSDGWAFQQLLTYAPTYQALLAIKTLTPNTDISVVFCHWVEGQRKLYGRGWIPSFTELTQVLQVLMEYQENLKKCLRAKPIHTYKMWLTIVRQDRRNYSPTQKELREIAKVCGYDLGWVHVQLHLEAKRRN